MLALALLPACTPTPDVSEKPTAGVDDCDTVPAYADTDGYGYGSGASVEVCEGEAGYVADAGDCADDEPDVHPGADDDRGNGVDDDCDGAVDEDWDPCSTPSGRVGLDTDLLTLSSGAQSGVATMYGLAWLCEATCTDTWLTATVGQFDPTCATATMDLPWDMTMNGTICVRAEDPGGAAEGTCTVRSSVGDLTVRVAWE